MHARTRNFATPCFGKETARYSHRSDVHFSTDGVNLYSFKFSRRAQKDAVFTMSALRPFRDIAAFPPENSNSSLESRIVAAIWGCFLRKMPMFADLEEQSP